MQRFAQALKRRRARVATFSESAFDAAFVLQYCNRDRSLIFDEAADFLLHLNFLQCGLCTRHLACAACARASGPNTENG